MFNCLNLPSKSNSVKDTLIELFRKHFSSDVDSIRELARSGSPRRYFRLSGGGHQCIAAYSPDSRETRAFLTFTRHFHDKGLSVPALLDRDMEKNIYLLEDLGDVSLHSLGEKKREGEEFPAGLIPMYRSALDHLVEFQLEGHVGLDYSVCIPRQEFDRQSILWDLNHFKYYFIKLLNIPFDEQQLENDFNTLSEHLLGADREHFMFRDFQSRNIMVRGENLYFIDYQGGRKGALQYDVASLLFEARTNIPTDSREELLKHYLERLREKSEQAAMDFMESYYAFVLIRLLQAMGAYGLRGIIENKALFLQSIPYAIANLKWLMDQSLIPDRIPGLHKCLEAICGLEEWSVPPVSVQNKLLVNINSFSYKKGWPRDLSGNGGGFVFDCRCLPNPGRLEEYRDLTGKDPEVIEYLKNTEEVDNFLEGIFKTVLQSIESYESMGFTHLMVSFGCTGGQHRSVYCAEKLNELLRDRPRVKTRLHHKELDE